MSPLTARLTALIVPLSALLSPACSPAAPARIYGSWETAAPDAGRIYGFLFAETLDADGTTGEIDVYEFSDAPEDGAPAPLERGLFVMDRAKGADTVTLTLLPAWRADGDDSFYREGFATEADADAFAADALSITSSDLISREYVRID